MCAGADPLRPPRRMLSTVSYVAKQGVLLARLSLTLYFYLGFGAQTHAAL